MATAARLVPWLILGYVGLLFITRMALSPRFLEIDEAQFFGAVDFRLVYDNSHPPLFNWWLRALLELTDWRWALACALAKFSLLGAFYALSWDLARRLGGGDGESRSAALRAGLLAVCAAAFLPQIIWQSAHTLAHSIMVLAGVVAMAHAAWRAVERPSAARMAWLGAAAALGALAKFNFFLFALPFLAALAAAPALRARLFRPTGWVGVGVFALLAGPSLAAAALDFGASAARLDKLYVATGKFAGLDPPGLGVDGLFSLVAAAAAWAAPLAVVWIIARGLDRRAESANVGRGLRVELGRGAPPPGALDPEPLRAAFVAAIGRAMLWAMAAFAVIVLLADMHRVHERYLTPILAPLGVWLACARPLRASAPLFAAAAAAVFLAAPLGVAGMVMTTPHRYAMPFEAIAAEIAFREPGTTAIRSRPSGDAANLAIARGGPAARSPQGHHPIGDALLMTWRGDRPLPEARAPEGFAPAGPRRVATAPLTNWRAERFTLSFQRYRRTSPARP